MVHQQPPDRRPSTETRSWPLELDFEVCASARRDATPRRLRSLVAHLKDADRIREASAEAHGPAELKRIRVRATVEAYDQNDALGTVSSLVCDGMSRTGLGSAILVAARPAPPPLVKGHRMS